MHDRVVPCCCLAAVYRGIGVAFFSSSVADVALMARSLHESKQKIHCTRTKRSLESANRLKQQSRKPQPNKKRRPANPPARLAFRQRKQRSKQQKTQQNPKNGARAQTKTPTESIYHWTQWHIHCITIKNMQNELWITAVQADMKTIAREFL